MIVQNQQTKEELMSSAVNPPAHDHEAGTRYDDRPQDLGGRVTDQSGPGRTEVVARERDRFGGMKFGSAFFGWLTATGTALLLTALLAAAGAAVGLGQNVQVPEPTTETAQTVGIVSGIVLLVITLVAYFCGGYVAGRMARFDGVKQGLGVWLWAVIAAIVVAILSAIAGAQFNILSNLNGFPRIPINEGTLTAGGIITAIAVAIAALVGALLGGRAGMRYHRRVDQAGLPG
jgi:hypothetical protein